MLIKTRGIVLNFMKFRETSIIARVYTEQLGVQSYIVNSVRTKGKGSRIALFQPFTLLDMVVYTSPKGGLTRISEYKCAHPFISIPFDIRKSSMVLFLSEVVARTVKEEEENQPLFQFLYQAILAFDDLEAKAIACKAWTRLSTLQNLKSVHYHRRWRLTRHGDVELRERRGDVI